MCRARLSAGSFAFNAFKKDRFDCLQDVPTMLTCPCRALPRHYGYHESDLTLSPTIDSGFFFVRPFATKR